MTWDPASCSREFYDKMTDHNEQYNSVTTNTLSRKIDQLDAKINKLIELQRGAGDES